MAVFDTKLIMYMAQLSIVAQDVNLNETIDKEQNFAKFNNTQYNNWYEFKQALDISAILPGDTIVDSTNDVFVITYVSYKLDEDGNQVNSYQYEKLSKQVI